MVLEDANIRDLVDTIEDQIKRLAKVEDIIEETHKIQPPAIERFNKQIARLRDVLDNHIAP